MRFFQPRSQGLSLRRERLVAAGHVPPRIWVVTKNSLKGGRLRLLLSILSLQESVKCCHQNKHFFHVAPVCCIIITVMSQCNTVQTPKKICTVDKILLRNNPPCGFGLSPRSRDQPQPGSLFSRSWGRGERDPGNPGNEVEVFLQKHQCHLPGDNFSNLMYFAFNVEVKSIRAMYLDFPFAGG